MRRFLARFTITLLIIGFSPVHFVSASQNYFEGDLRVISVDAKDSAKIVYLLSTASGQYELIDIPVSLQGGLKNKNKVKVGGSLKNGKISVSEAVVKEDRSGLRKALTTYKPIVIRFNFQNDTSQPFSAATLESELYTSGNSTKNFYQENSYSKINLTGSHADITPWYTVPFSSGAGCSYSYGGELDQWTQNAYNQAFVTGSTVPEYRFWSDAYQHHFFTSSESEKNLVMATYPESVWRYEGIANYVYTSSQPNTVPVYRFWSDTYRGHFFTSSEAEKNQVMATYPESVWRYEGIANYVFSTQQAPAFNPADYTHFFFVFAYNSSCGWAGLGEVTGNTLWSNGYSASELYSHEFGHNLGFGHASYMDCGADIIRAYETCYYHGGSGAEYGDEYDVMGGSWNNYHSNAIFKSWMNWITPAEIVTVSADGPYTINPLEESGSAVKAIKIHKTDTDDDYWIEYRKATGFDSSMPAGATAGIMIRIEGITYDPNNTYVLDLTPPDDWNNVVLTDGVTFDDTSNGIQITQTAHDSSGVTLNINFY